MTISETIDEILAISAKIQAAITKENREPHSEWSINHAINIYLKLNAQQ